MAQSEFSLRDATEDDLPEVVRIESEVYPFPWSEDGFRAEMQKPYSRIWVMTDDETDTVIVGYIVFWILFEESQILNVAVDLKHRGQAMAQKMIRKAADLALRQSLKRMILDVRKSNTPAILLYQKLGFVIEQVRKGFYSNGEDSYGMVLDLKSEKLLEF